MGTRVKYNFPVSSSLRYNILCFMKKFIHAVGIIFENSNKEILILKRHISSMEGNTWGLVGGKVDECENKYQAAIREAREEVGVDIEDMYNLSEKS